MVKNTSLYFIGFIISLALIGGGYWFYRLQKERILEEKYNDLEAIAELKVGTLAQWQLERIGDIQTLVGSPIFREEVIRWLSKRGIESAENLSKHMHLLTQHYDFENIMISSADGEMLLSADTLETTFHPVTIRLIKEAVVAKDVEFSGFYLCPMHKLVHLDFISSLQDEDGKTLAVFVFRVNPSTTLFPLIQDWPTPSKSAETLIIREEGDDVLFLNELRHQKNTAMKLRIPLSDTLVPAVKAVAGYRGMWRGPDYRGVPVLAAIKEVPGTDWFMISKVDESEILMELRYMAVLAVVLVFILLVLLGVTLVLLNNYRLRKVYKNLFRTEKELHKTEGEFRTTLYSIGDAVITTDTQGRVRQMNKVAAQLTGYAEDQARGEQLQKAFNIINEATRKKVESPFDKVMREGKIVGLANHTLLISKDGKETPIADSGAPIRDEHGKINGVVLVFRDQTEERRMIDALKSNEESYRSLFSSIRDGIIVADRDRNVLSCNPAFFQMFKMKEEDIIGKPTRILYQEEIKANEVGKAIDQNLDSAKAFFHVSRFKRNDGSSFIGEVHMNYLRDIHGEIIGLIGVIRDVTERIRSEQMIAEQNEELRMVNENLVQAKEKAEESDRLKTAFLQNLSHEIRTPMNAIMGFSSLLMPHLDQPEKVNKFVEIIHQRSSDLLGIINDILDTAKIDSGQLSVDVGDCRIKELCEEMKESFIGLQQKTGREKLNLSVKMDLDPTVHVIRTDCVKFRQIMNNLVTNAFKYTIEGSVVIHCFDRDDQLHVAVSDTGIGIPEDQQERIFERFMQTEEAQELMAGGTGLGLSIARGLAEMLGGSISLESEHGKGSTFTFSIPLVKVTAQKEEETKANVKDGYDFSGKTILVVEDDEFNAEYIFEILRPTGAKILHTMHGKEAVKMSEDHKPDIILMDIRLPDINGYEATEQIVKLYPKQKIISQTAYASVEDRQRSLDAGCIDYISKPIDPNDLLELVTRHIAS